MNSTRKTVTPRQAIAAAEYLNADVDLSGMPMTMLVRLVERARKAGADL